MNTSFSKLIKNFPIPRANSARMAYEPFFVAAGAAEFCITGELHWFGDFFT